MRLGADKAATVENAGRDTGSRQYRDKTLLHGDGYGSGRVAALAYAGLADCFRFGRYRRARRPVSEVLPKAKAAARRSLEIDEGLAEAQTTMAVLLYRYDWDFPPAEKHYKRALELNSTYAMAHLEYAVFLLSMERTEEPWRTARAPASWNRSQHSSGRFPDGSFEPCRRENWQFRYGVHVLRPGAGVCGRVSGEFSGAGRSLSWRTPGGGSLRRGQQYRDRSRAPALILRQPDTS